MNPDDELVRLRTAMNPAEAHLVEQTLRDNGIESRAVGDYLDAGLGDIPGMRAEVWVKKRDVAAAQAALASARTLMAPEQANEEES
jgi:Putative prokaryotic signal transducing protein